MTRAEAIQALSIAKHVAPWLEAGMMEDAELRLLGGMTPAQAREYAALLLQPGRRGRVSLVLRRPAEARALGWLACLLRQIGDHDK